MTSVSEGIFYIATGEKYAKEAAISAQSVREQMPEVDISIVTDSDYDFEVFSNIIITDDPAYSFRDNIDYINKSPYDRTIFLDSDTYVASDISEIFELLDNFDIAAAHDTGRRRELYRDQDINVFAPNCFPMYNTGVMAYVDTPSVRQLFEAWNRIYNRHETKTTGIVNQPAFREALYKSSVGIATLPPEYNCRIPYPTYLLGEVKILHGRASNYKSMISKLNTNSTIRRTFISLSGANGPIILRLDIDKWQNRQQSLFDSLFDRGIIQTASGLVRHIRGGDFWQ